MSVLADHLEKRDHYEKITGKAQYVDDLQIEGLLHGKLLRSTKAKAKIKEIQIPQLPEGYCIVDHNDVPGINGVAMIDMDVEVFAKDKVEYISEPILMVVGEKIKTVEEIMKKIVIVYEEEKPVFNVFESDTIFYEFSYEKGNIDEAFKSADKIIEESFFTGYQEQAYIETQGMIGYYDNDTLVIRGSMQCPYYLHNAVKIAMGIEDPDKINIIYDTTGGAFGGKEDYPSVLACQVAVATHKTKRPVKVILERKEDIQTTSKRHPAYVTYKTAMKNDKIIGMDVNVTYDCGAYKTMSLVVLQRGIIGACGVYRIDNLRVHGRSIKTNTVPNGAFRGFGGPQTFFAIEMHMNHIAKEYGYESLVFKEKYMSKEGDPTSTSGKYHQPIVLPEMIDKIDKMSDYRRKVELYKHQTGRYRKGIGLSMAYHGCGFTGNGERDKIKAKFKLVKYADDTVEILCANTDMGQGLRTTFTKIVSEILEIPTERVKFVNPSTLRVPDSGPTVASRSLMNVGKLLERACKKLKSQWKSGEYIEINEDYIHPDFLIPFEVETFSGDAYPSYSWSVNVIELSVDILTGVTDILGSWGVYDIGVPIDEKIATGQMEGGFMQAIGYGSMEQMDARNGVIRNSTLSDYIIPTSNDVPNMKVDFVKNPYEYGPFGAKGAGELPAVGGAPAYIAALENALETRLYKTPVSMEDIMSELEGKNGQ
ncbi:xanthine dehydrogenase family protein molybdopterin-binding subunit [Fusobacterium sp. PH5-44]|uniref:xanthine dehydrogenase family protein molybdopterin-binding subunit n=1 Tax=unclassified Fusobacterium TaxID=2648384 RepID=UPI003D1BDA1E